MGGRAARMARSGDKTAQRIVQADKVHNQTVEIVRAELIRRRIHFSEGSIASLNSTLRKKISAADLTITIGGDGTALGASHFIREGAMLSVNSAPGDSVGHFCSLDAQNFPARLDDILKGRWKPSELARIEVALDFKVLPELALNDLLIAHESPGSTTRYLISVRNHEEEHRSSGIWISTAAGSTAAIRSAGGTVMSLKSRRLQFLVRELYRAPGNSYRLAKGMASPDSEIIIASKMTEGRIFIDGSKTCYEFPFGVRANIRAADHNLRIFLSKQQLKQRST